MEGPRNFAPASPDRGRPSSEPLPPLTTLRKRGDFLRASRGMSVAGPGFILQAIVRPAGDANGIRVGYTCSRKVGNAVARNRAKRRLREIARLVLPQEGLPGTDYVLVGRREVTSTRLFSTMVTDLRQALHRLHGNRE